MIRLVLTILTAMLACASGAHAASISISPIFMRVIAPGKQTGLTINNQAKQAITVQVRVFR